MTHKLLEGERFLAHLSIDKPLYKPGETVYGRAAVLDAFSHEPVKKAGALTFEVRSPKGDVVHTSTGQVEDGVAPFSFDVPKDIAGGSYKLVAKFAGNTHPKGERKFDIRAFRVPRLKSELEFVKKAYGPGDTVVATLEVKRAEGGVPAGARVTAVATVDSVEVHRSDLELDGEGTCEVQFPLPEDIDEGDGTLVMLIRDGGVQESAAKTIPITVTKIKLDFYPEGGDLVVGLPSRIYFEAETHKGKPADVAGRIIDARGTTLASFRTDHEGRGRASVTPKKPGSIYMAVLDEPAGLEDIYPMPEVKKKGFVLSAVDDVGVTGGPVKMRAACTDDTDAVLSLYHRDREVASVDLSLTAGQPEDVVLTPPRAAGGVLRATLLDADGMPRAERLIFQKPKKRVQVAIEVVPERASLRDQVTVKVRTSDEKGKPVSAMVTAAVVDDAVLETVDRREQMPRLPVQVLLEGEVARLYDPHVYLEDGEKAALRVDLLLGTQGWRRFAFFHIDDFLAEHEDSAERVLATRRPPPPPPRPVLRGFGGGIPGGGPPMPQAMPRPMAARPMAVRPMAPRPMPAPPPAAAPPVAPMKAMVADLGGDFDDELEGAAFGGLAMDEADGFAEAVAPPPGPAPVMPAQAAMPPMPAQMAMPPAPPFPPPEEAKPGLLGRIGRALGLGRKAEVDVLEIDAPPPPPPPPRPFMPPPVQAPAMAVRVYAHQVSGSAKEGRTDFAQTLYWNAGVQTFQNGEGEFSFQLCDSVTSFKVMVDAFSRAGAVGSADSFIESRRPFYVEPKLPIEVTAGDGVQAPIAVVNGTQRELSAELSMSLQGPIRSTSDQENLVLDPDGRSRILLPLEVRSGSGQASVRVQAKAGRHRDDVTRGLEVTPNGFPLEVAFGGKLDADARHTFTVPDSVIPGSLAIEAQVYPSPLASLEEAVTALLREPCGCFEQTSSSTYPNIMVMQYLTSHTGVAPASVKRAGRLLDKGYKKLVSFECKEKGYEWFGGDPGHEALTAYGLMEFSDMAEVYPVDGGMLARTRAWLLSRRDGKGGFERNSRALDSFGRAPDDITNAYITWALSQSKVEDLAAEVGNVKKRAKTSDDPYLLALAANVLLDASDPGADAVLTKLAKKQAKDGSFTGAKTSITCSGGDSLLIETTSLAILAFLRSPAHTQVTESAMQWLLKRCKGGRFGATQSTILALKAIVTYDVAHASPKKAGTVRLRLDKQDKGEQSFEAETQGVISLLSAGHSLAAGDHELVLAMEQGAAMPYSLRVQYYAQTPASAPDCKVSLTTELSSAEVEEGLSVDLRVELANITDEGLPMTVAVIGLPGGLEPRADQLEELVKEGKIDFFELRNREVILYRREMAPKERSHVVLSLLAAIPGQYTGPASRAYLYYTDEDKIWAEPLAVTIAADAG